MPGALAIQTELESNERIIGIKSRKSYDELSALHYDFQFVVGKLE
jgi:hypothetical protein